jgi:hypothetical protein
MSAVIDFTTNKCRPAQHMEMFVTEFDGLAMRLEAIGHGVSEQNARCQLSQLAV